MRYRYRYVGFGTRFSQEKGRRPEGELDPSKLYGNELALDVGGVCLGHADVDHHIIDHHFYRQEGQYPAAAAAVLHLAPRIVERFGDEDGDLWLVSHRDPDFDALGSMYLVRCLLEGTIPARDWEGYGLRPDGWYQGRSEIEWFQPKVGGLPPDRRWPILIAAYSACVDNGRRLACPRNRSLHSVLYAAMARGRDYRREDDGALEFFGEVRRNLKDPKHGLNPLIDSVLEQSEVFAPELAMLDREVEAYRRDIRRARKAVVFLQESKVPFQEWFPKVQSLPLLKSDGSLDPAHLRPPDQGGSQVEGVYIRDPECLLFKEWARLDTEHSILGQGFLFTAVAYSRGRREATVNQTDYYFALDPERAGGRHLYNVWARLQAEEARPNQGCLPGGSVRSGFEGRAPGSEAAFVDPWFDGHNYACTIVVTPNRGTGIAPAGTAGDLSDDRVALLVQQELELSVFASDVTVHDLAASNTARPAPGARSRSPRPSGTSRPHHRAVIASPAYSLRTTSRPWRPGSRLRSDGSSGGSSTPTAARVFRTRPWAATWWSTRRASRSGVAGGSSSPGRWARRRRRPRSGATSRPWRSWLGTSRRSWRRRRTGSPRGSR